MEYTASEERISKLEGELKRAVDEEAETARQLDTEHNRRAALDEQLRDVREEAARLVLEHSSKTRDVMLADAEEFVQASRVEAEREAAQVTKRAFDQANEMIAIARRQSVAILDAGREAVRALEDDATQRMADLDTEDRDLAHRLGVMETICDELVATLKLVAEISTEELVETRESLKQLDFGETEQPPTEPNSGQTSSGSALQHEIVASVQLQADGVIQEAQGEVARLVREAPAEASGGQDQLKPVPGSVPESQDDGTQELAFIIDDRDLGQRRYRYRRWLNLNREDRDTKENRARPSEAISERFSRVLSLSNNVEGADPEEVEARIRNLSHGTNSD